MTCLEKSFSLKVQRFEKLFLLSSKAISHFDPSGETERTIPTVPVLTFIPLAQLFP